MPLLTNLCLQLYTWRIILLLVYSQTEIFNDLVTPTKRVPCRTESCDLVKSTVLFLLFQLAVLQLLKLCLCGGGTRPVLSQFCSEIFRFSSLRSTCCCFKSRTHLPMTSTTSHLLFRLVCSCLLGENPKHSGSTTDSLHQSLFVCLTKKILLKVRWKK